MLRECTKRLLETVEFIRNVGQNNSTDLNTQTTTATSTAASTWHPRPNSTATGGRAQDSIRNEHNRLFGYRPPGPSRAPQPRGSATSRTRRSPYTNSTVGRANATWSRSFVCLAVAGQRTPPSTSEHIDLSLNGLGEKRGTLPKSTRQFWPLSRNWEEATKFSVPLKGGPGNCFLYRCRPTASALAIYKVSLGKQRGISEPGTALFCTQHLETLHGYFGRPNQDGYRKFPSDFLETKYQILAVAF